MISNFHSRFERPLWCLTSPRSWLYPITTPSESSFLSIYPSAVRAKLTPSLQQGKSLQTGFQIGMERILGVSQRTTKGHYAGREDTHKADQLVQDESRDAARQRYVRAYWESVPLEGQVCTILDLL